MKIAGTGPINTPSLRRRDKARDVQKGGFASELSHGTRAAGAPGSGQVESISSLLAAQELDEEPQNNRKSAIDQAELLLDKLDQLRHRLLVGTVSSRQLSDLVTAAGRRRDRFIDPRIREILDEIELRASVELAKMGQKS
jgi:Class II flagellar assembly regulator